MVAPTYQIFFVKSNVINFVIVSSVKESSKIIRDFAVEGYNIILVIDISDEVLSAFF